jgi:hypothetical protein
VLTIAADFWPTFWTILIGGAAVTVALCFAIAVVPARSAARRHHQPPVLLHLHRRAGALPRAGGMPHAA